MASNSSKRARGAGQRCGQPVTNPKPKTLNRTVLRAAPEAARRTNKDGQLPVHLLAAHFARDDNVESLQVLLRAFPEAAEVPKP